MRHPTLALAVAATLVSGCALVHERDAPARDGSVADPARDGSLGDAFAVDARLAGDGAAPDDAWTPGNTGNVVTLPASAHVVAIRSCWTPVGTSTLVPAWSFRFYDGPIRCADVTQSPDSFIGAIVVRDDPPTVGRPYRIRGFQDPSDGRVFFISDVGTSLGANGTFTYESFTPAVEATFSYDLSNTSDHYVTQHVSVTVWCDLGDPGC